MALVIGTDSWATLVEADAYLTNKVGTSEWFSLTDTPATPGAESKESFMIMAYNQLLTKVGYDIPSDSTDENVKKGQIEFAYYLLTSGDEYNQRVDLQSQGVTEFKLSKWSEKYSEESILNQPLPSIVANFLSDYIRYNMTGSYKE